MAVVPTRIGPLLNYQLKNEFSQDNFFILTKEFIIVNHL